MSIHFLLLWALLGCTASISALSGVPTFNLDLDLPPQQRWLGAVDTILQHHSWETSFGPVLDLYLPISLLVPEDTKTLLLNKVKNVFPDQYGELLGLYNAFDQRQNISKLVTADEFVAVLYAYEIEHINFLNGNNKKRNPMLKSCTGILSLPEDPSQDILHGRNMDEQPHPGRNLTLHINATKGGKTVWEALDWLWFTTGVGTTQQQGAVTLELNYRGWTNGEGNDFHWPAFSSRVNQSNNIPVLLLHRILMERDNGKYVSDFAQTIKFLTTPESSSVAVPFYVVMSGTHRRGAVLTMHYHQASINVAYLNDTTRDPKTKAPIWFMVQTNYDRWLPDQKDWPWPIGRRTQAENSLAMEGRSRSGSKLGVWMALSTYPVHNPDTMYTALLSVAEPIEGYIRQQMVPQNTYM